jgi:hypothetical protein
MRKLEEGHGKVVTKKMQIYYWHKRFSDGHVIHAAGDCYLRQMNGYSRRSGGVV